MAFVVLLGIEAWLSIELNLTSFKSISSSSSKIIASLPRRNELPLKYSFIHPRKKNPHLKALIIKIMPIYDVAIVDLLSQLWQGVVFSSVLISLCFFMFFYFLNLLSQ